MLLDQAGQRGASPSRARRPPPEAPEAGPEESSSPGTGGFARARSVCRPYAIVLASAGEDDPGKPVGEGDSGKPVEEGDPGKPVEGDDPGKPVGEDDPGTTPLPDTGVWPKTVTLAVQGLGKVGEHVRLSDGAVSDAGDLGVGLSRFVTLQSPGFGSICDVRRSFAKLADIPTDVAACSQWLSVVNLSSLFTHESHESVAIGAGLLVWDAEHSALYRLRVLGDSYDPNDANARSTATFEYEPVR